MSAPIVVVGDALLDVDLTGTTSRLAPDAPVPVLDQVVERARPGGAALAAYLTAVDAGAGRAGAAGREVVLLTPLADDAPAARVRELLAPYLHVVALPYRGSTAVKTRVRAAGQSLLRIDTGGSPGPVGELPPAARAALSSAAAVLVADYGRGATAAASVRAALAGLPARRPVVWDPHPLGAEPVPGVRLATPNRAEAARAAARAAAARPIGALAATPAACTGQQPGGADGADDAGRADSAELATVAAWAAALVRAWAAGSVAITLGAAGALLSFGDGSPLVVPAPPAGGGDPCGAGDRFAAAALALLARGALPSEAVQGAVAAASAFVSAGGAAALGFVPVTSARPDGAGTAVKAATCAATPAGSTGVPVPALAVVERVRAGGGTVVATGGCFDLLHAGHVASLQAARALGDCLVVCLNSDASVRALKGADRPLQRQEDRARVLLALECVDAVAVFDEATPEAVLDRLRPHVWVKGGDYAGVELPESRLLASWGGTAVVLPYLDGRSTSLLVQAARRTAQPPAMTSGDNKRHSQAQEVR